MNINLFLLFFLIGSSIDFTINSILEFIDYRHRKLHGKEIPEEVAGSLSNEDIEKTISYENTKFFTWIPHHIISFALSLAMVLSGFYGYVFERIYSFIQEPLPVLILYSVILSIPSSIISLPFELYNEFVVEKKFGFSTMTFPQWILDQIKGILVSAVIGVPLLAAAIQIITKAQDWWWLILGGVMVLFSLGISFIYPTIIAPLFNKFTPVDNKEIKSRIENLFKKTGFKSSGIFIMDASKRSRHSNAYFTGFGKNKRIVLYDTLVNQLTAEEIEAVLGHELGHCKKHHITKRMCISIPMTFAILFIASKFIHMNSLYQAFGFTIAKIPVFVQLIGISLLFEVFGGFRIITNLISNWSSRRDEFEADKFSRETCGTPEPLISSLIKLNKENSSQINVAKIYSMFNYNHPPLLERIRALRLSGKENN